MSDPTGDPGAELPEGIAALLAREATWHPAPDGGEDALVRAIAAAAPATPSVLTLVDGRGDRSARRSAWPWWLATAAAAVAVVAGAVLVVSGRDGDGDGAGAVVAALVGTDLAPGASASAVFESTPAGLKIVLDAEGLPGAPEGEMYEAWISDGEIRVSAGTFHLRGGDAPIELWAGTADPAFRTITVTLEPIDGDASSSGRVVLRGEYVLPAD